MTLSAMLAFACVVVIMAVVGYALSRLAQSPQAARPLDSIATDADTQTDSTDDAAAASTLPDEQLIEVVNRKLPQTQCAQCGHPGCRPYAQAIIVDNAPINQCPPGGQALIEELAELLGTQVLALDSDKGQTKPAQVAVIVEPDCIGCVLCIAACPVDAIVGAAKYMHTVIADQCTGCELCLPPCPVDCIELHPVETPLHRWQWPKPQ